LFIHVPDLELVNNCDKPGHGWWCLHLKMCSHCDIWGRPRQLSACSHCRLSSSHLRHSTSNQPTLVKHWPVS